MARLLTMRLALALLVVRAFGQEVKPRRPIVTTDIVHGTGELLYDMYSAAYNKFLVHHVDKHSKTVREAIEPMLPEDPMGQICSKVGLEKQELLRHMDSASYAVSNASAQAAEHGSRVYELLSRGAHFVVDGFERLLPTHKGLIGRQPLDLLIFCLWVVVVLYITMKIGLVFFKIAWSIFIFGLKMMCCCGCCGLCFRRKPPPKGAQRQRQEVNTAGGSASRMTN
ncbi:unnamed protein product [Effrenium voratum]|nr:unnamed protein product [Effrenium voratum]|eukprot:CAMPEP_0181499262 /NCGR_PEP_ID=MMETSP1110-20121109/54558_1 /TAXON_ID=174948 /ORGANISM="Symbiodinium sp., Strain CCMP421" /LENGTH=224 /DNA_ID=CAMNT_0023627423 /DNA_START=22 /DNA_END=699 /DNA_ORIENTATION=+